MHSARQFASTSIDWAQRFVPAPLAVQAKERWRIVFGAAFGILLTGLLSRWLGPEVSAWMVAPIGASAVLVFALPSSPLAQPWSVVGGNTVSALVGTACALLIPDPVAAAAVAVSLAIGAMVYLRCLHPPGGAAALLVVLAHSHSWAFVAFPVLGNSVLLVCMGLVFNTLTGHTYPHKHAVHKDAAQAAQPGRFTRADLDAALQHYNEVMDVDPEDLIELLHHAESVAYQRTLGELRCRDIMTPDPHCVEFGTGLSDAWALMRKHQIKALPVVDRKRRVVGIITVADFLRHARMDEHNGLADRLQRMLRPSGLTHSEKPEVIGQIMTRQVRVASAQRHAVELLPLFSEAGHHHLPIIDEENRLVGILTQSDLVRSLSKAVKPSF
jgi:CBS domain-containing membrane protein